MSIADIGKIVDSKNVKIPLLARRTVLQRDQADLVRPCDVERQRENDSQDNHSFKIVNLVEFNTVRDKIGA
jgi:hypothetical protein